MKEILIVYGTTGGNTELVCQKVARQLQSHGAEVRLQRCELTKPQELQDCTALILACPTYGHGVLEVHFGKFFETIQDLDLTNKSCAVIALGDPKYDLDYFLESEKILKNYIETHNGKIICDSLKIAKTPVTYLEKWISKWADTFYNTFSK